MILAIFILFLVTAQRITELILAKHNTKRLLARGGIEKSPKHYVFIVFMHAAWLLLLWIDIGNARISFGWLALFILLQFLRIWVIATLGERWTTRIIVVPGEPRVLRGPYRFLAHPNYVIVAAEIIALPMALGLPWIALVFTTLNAAVLWVRIRAEEKALDEAES